LNLPSHKFLAATAVAALTSLLGCTRHTIDVQPIRIEPIYMTIDVNVKVDRELDEFFDYKNKPAEPAPSSTTPAPTANPDVAPPPGGGTQ
jgi:hypothetical protein